ncbi:MAG: hypothetical protein KAG66_02700 [Methylococcales bacterium]|nr:hypothetical protein [Methylococcales bacterium]
MQLLQSVIGAAGKFLSNPFRRRFRDIHAAGSQIQVIFDINGAEFGRVELGFTLSTRQSEPALGQTTG